jgi:hypothetical protein
MTGRLASQSRNGLGSDVQVDCRLLKLGLPEADPGYEMRIRRLGLLVIPVVALLLALPVTSGASGLQNCGGGVRASKVSCSKAKRIAAEYAKTRAHSLQGYKCSGGGNQGRCVLDRKVVVFPL